MIRSCIFDLDGTLVNTVPALKRCMDLTLEAHGFPPLTEDQVRRFVGNGLEVYTRRAFLAQGLKDESFLPTALETYRRLFRDNCLYENRPYPGIPELLRELKKRGMLLAVLSNKPDWESRQTIFNSFPKDLFDRIVGARPGVPMKPDPGSLLALLEELGTAPEECLFFGDTTMDVEAGNRAGAHTVAVLWGFRGEAELRESRPEYIISEPMEILHELSAHSV